jgi:hypothetical protein
VRLQLGIQTQRLFLVDQTCTVSPSYRDHANFRTAPARIAVLRTKIIAVTIAGPEFAKATLGRPRKAFIELRYYYELPLKKGYGWTGMEISDCVRHVILELKQDWKDALTKFTPRVIPLSAEHPPGTLPTATPWVK